MSKIIKIETLDWQRTINKTQFSLVNKKHKNCWTTMCLLSVDLFSHLITSFLYNFFMKQVSNTRKTINKKDLFHWFLIYFMHYISFSIYILIFLITNHYVNGGSFISGYIYTEIYIMLTFVLAPLITGTLHIIYSELGSPWLRLIMWLYAFTNMILLPILVFVV